MTETKSMISELPFPVTIQGNARSTSLQISAGKGQWFIPEEVPIAIVYNRRNYAVMMGTPDNLVDFGVGFSLTDEVINSVSDIKSLNILLSHKGADLRFKVSNKVLEKLDITQRRRNLVGSASCGLCGLESADTLFKILPRVIEEHVTLKPAAMERAMTAMWDNQPLNTQTRSVHAAAWVSPEGDIKLIREDVGRHNALDKLLGAMALAGANTAEGFVLMSSRCSFEIVEKAARRGVTAILSISGPTAFALRKAKEANMAIYSRSGDSAVRLH